MPDPDAKPKNENLKRPSKSFKEMTGAEYMAYANAAGA